MRRWPGLVAAGVALSILASGCGGSGGAVEIPSAELPFDVRRGEGAPTATAVGQTHTIYLTDRGRLVGAVREFRVQTSRAEDAVRALLAGPTTSELRVGIRTMIPDSVRLLRVVVDAGVATVDFSGEFQQPADQSSIELRMAQVVWTLTATGGVEAVRFSIEGEPVAVVTGAGRSVERPVRRTDYGRFSPGG